MKLFVKPEACHLLTNISRFLAEEGIQSYLVGGFVRDMLLGRDTADIDIAVAADALKIAPKIASAFGGRYVPLDEENGVGRVILFNNGTAPAKGKWELDFSTLKGNIEQDLAQRDFTIDAMAIELERIFPESLRPIPQVRELKSPSVPTCSSTPLMAGMTCARAWSGPSARQPLSRTPPA